MSRKLFGFERLEEEAVERTRANLQFVRDNGEGDTPIEKLFFAALVVVSEWGHRVHNNVSFGPLEKRGSLYETEVVHGDPLTWIYVSPQVQLPDWRVDFLISVVEPNGSRESPTWHELIVECDGHDFHERTKLQAAKDRSRDRSAQLGGRIILRFTGSELWRDPVACADEVLQWADNYT